MKIKQEIYLRFNLSCTPNNHKRFDKIISLVGAQILYLMLIVNCLARVIKMKTNIKYKSRKVLN